MFQNRRGHPLFPTPEFSHALAYNPNILLHNFTMSCGEHGGPVQSEYHKSNAALHKIT